MKAMNKLKTTLILLLVSATSFGQDALTLDEAIKQRDKLDYYQASMERLLQIMVTITSVSRSLTLQRKQSPKEPNQLI